MLKNHWKKDPKEEQQLNSQIKSMGEIISDFKKEKQTFLGYQINLKDQVFANMKEALDYYQ